MSEEEKKAIDNLKHYVNNIETYNFEKTDGFKWVKTALNLLENQQKELERYKRIAEMNLKDSEEFKENMCEHRCILHNQIMELTEELEQEKEIEKSHQEENGKLRVELEQEKEKNKELEEKLKIAKQIYNDACVCIATECVEKDKMKEKIEEINSEKLNYNEDEYYLENEIKGYAIAKLKELLEEN